jgi:hypothetical protein
MEETKIILTCKSYSNSTIIFGDGNWIDIAYASEDLQAFDNLEDFLSDCKERILNKFNYAWVDDDSLVSVLQTIKIHVSNYF